MTQDLSRDVATLNQDVRTRFGTLTTAHVADACIRAQVQVRCAPAAVTAVVPGSHIAGRACPARHAGSVDIFLEALGTAAAGDILVIDNGGRLDESCIGDLIDLEVQTAGLEGIVVWGLHRDTAEIRTIGLPVFSLGATSTGPQRLDARHPDALASAGVGEWTVTSDDVVFGDDDGVLFVPASRVIEVLTVAATIFDTERHQADRVRAGDSLRQQFQFDGYLATRAKTPSTTFRDHLRSMGGAVEV